ncbi:hypothetical protein N7456_009118 [Penicillium angulare]|uniref:E3 ubiquitin-protein ligase n=1 Tax=Penicillium angulare TaxID=116970 RepID=A0A9W9K5U3_9EURO|nr:hypothetical protein N7456_009118 [Penicillium angulare]
MSSGLDIPKSGLSLRHEEQSGPSSVKPAQIMRLNLAQNTMDELIQSLINNQPSRVRLGKHPSIQYAGKSQSFHAYPETHRSEIYHSSTDGTTDDQSLYFTGVLSHSLEVEKAKQATAATDQALANLEESLNAFERGKESKKTHLLQHPDELRALRDAGGGSSARRAPKSKAELERDRLLRTAANRSLTSSPTLGAPRSPVPGVTPTSAPSSQIKNNARLDALKTPFIHLLAVRAVSTKFLSRQTRSTIEDCGVLAQKYGAENRINREKFDLKDKSYKDLDVWKFPYPNQEDRQQAIENATSAFDRMRISRSDKLWQMLLPKEERGKGKCLSRLNLSTGPVKKAAAPRIQVDGADDRDEASGNEVDRSTGSGTSKGLDGATPRSNAAQKSQKEPAKRPVKGKTTGTTNNNSTLTGRVTKKTAIKAPAKVESKFKSAEFVNSSDDEDSDMPDATPPSPPSAPAARPKEVKPAPPKKTQAQKNPPQKAPVPAKRPAVDTVPASKAPKAEAPTPKLESSQAKTASKKPAARQSTSPQKPSPLGSSPPTNASEVSNDRRRADAHHQSSSSSSSSPLISQLSRTNKATAAARTTKPAGQNSAVTKSTATANPLKRKAEPAGAHPAPARNTGNLDHKRRRAVSASSGGSTGSASPPMSFDIARQRLSERSQLFKRNYAKYKNLHKNLETQAHPSQADLDKLVRQHEHLQKEKREIWDEDRRLREGNLM